jgi:hypothetical protein
MRALVGAACVGSDSNTLVDRIAQAQRRALAAVRSHCGTADFAHLRRVVMEAGCRADDVTSAVFPTAKEDLGTIMAGDLPLGDHFPCLVGGGAGHEHTHE